MTEPPSPGELVWRPLLPGRVVLVLLGIMWLGLAATILTDPTGLPSGFDIELTIIFFVLLMIAAACISIAYSYIAVEADHLVIRNFLPVPRRIPLASIRAVVVGYHGLEVRVRGSRWTTYGWAVQQSNWRSVTGRPGRSEHLLRSIKDRAPNVYVPQIDRP